MKRKELAIVVGTVLGLSLGAPALVLGQQQGMTEPATDPQPKRSEDTANGQGMAGAQVSGEIMNMTAGELRGETIYNANGDELGTVDSVVTDQNQQLNVVLSVGGFLGIAQQRVVVPVSQLIRTDDRITTDSAISADTLAESAAYEEDAYNPISEDMRLSAVAGQQRMQPPMAGEAGAVGEELVGFDNLDADGNGFISRQEAETSAPLLNNWPVVDIDSDDQLDEAEFSAFEAGYKARLQGSQGMQGQPSPGSEAAPEQNY